MQEETYFDLTQKEKCRAVTPLGDRQPYSLLNIQRVLLAESLRSENPGLNLEQVVAELDESLDEDMMLAA